MTLGWGTQQWGLDSWGGLTGSMSVSSAYAISTHEVLVTLSKPPMDVTGFLPGDVSNPGSWSVSVPATGQVLDVAGVYSYARPKQWVVRTLQRLPDSLAVARVTATTLKDAAGGTVGPPASFDFAGVTELAISTPTQLASTKQRTGRDLQNLPNPSLGESNISGVLVIVGGDYALTDGEAQVKKLITRRVMTTPSEFFHLPNYGVGLKLKQPLPGGSLVRLKTRIENQVLMEPDISSVIVSLSQSNSMLTCVVNATLAKTGQKVTVGINSPIGQG